MQLVASVDSQLSVNSSFITTLAFEDEMLAVGIRICSVISTFKEEEDSPPLPEHVIV